MKVTFIYKYLSGQDRSVKAEGYSLIELLVVLVIIGILASIALPSFLSQVNKARESEGKTYIGSLNRAQQAFYLEKTTFTTDISLLGLGIQTETVNYQYKAQRVNEVQVANVAYPQHTDVLRAYTGGVNVALTSLQDGEVTTLSVLCQSIKPQAGSAGAVDFNEETGPVCNGTFEALN